MMPVAQVTMSKLIRHYCALVPLLRELGFVAVAFSYPQRARLGSSSLAWSDDSTLVKFTSSQLIEAFDEVDYLRGLFPVNNPRASTEDMKRHLRGGPERFVCYGGYKSFYLDWNYDLWRCDAWDQRLCSVWEFLETPLVRDGCTACMADCYRDSSVMLRAAVSLGDAIDRLGEGRVLAALKTLAEAQPRFRQCRREKRPRAVAAGQARLNRLCVTFMKARTRSPSYLVLFLARIADHLHISNLHMAVLGIAFLHVSIGGRILRVFLQVMCCRVGYDSRGRHLMAQMVG